MLRIAICDDDSADVKIIHDCLSATLFDVEDIQVSSYPNGKELINHLQEDPEGIDLLLLDIGMTPVDGMEAAGYIRDQKLDMDIIFITKSTEYVYQGYQYRAYAYILKDHLKMNLPEVLVRYVEELIHSEAYMNVSASGEMHRVPMSAIRYVESSGRKLILHLADEEISFYSKMSDIEDEMGRQGFVRIHQSYMVSKKYVRKMRKDAVVLEDMELPVSRRYAEQAKQMLS